MKGKVDIGLKFLTSVLLPYLLIGITRTNLRQDGKDLLWTDSLNKLHNIGEILSATCLNSKEGISFKYELLDLNESIAFFTSSAVI